MECCEDEVVYERDGEGGRDYSYLPLTLRLSCCSLFTEGITAWVS
jgi:hypothetical protein